MGAVGDTRPRAKGRAFAAGAGEERDRLDPFELVVLALGFGLCHAWVVGFLAFAARYSLNESGLFGYDQVYLFAGALAAILVSCLSCAHRPGSPARCAVRNAGADASKSLSDAPAANSIRFTLVNVACCIVALCMLGVAASTLMKPLLLVAFALCGASSALLQVAWGIRFSRLGMATALLSVPMGAMATAIIMIVLPDSALLMCLYVLPTLSLLLLHAHRAGDGAVVLSLKEQESRNQAGDMCDSRAADERGEAVSLATFVRLMASIAVFSLVGRCLDSFPAATVEGGVPSFVADNYAFLAVFAVGAVLAVFALMFRERFDVMLVYRLSLPCMVAGFAILTMFMDRFTVVSIAVVTVGYEFFDLLFWVLLVGLSRQGAAPRPLFVFGWGVAMTYAGMGAGTLLSRIVVPPILASTLDMSALALMCILVLVVLVVLVLPEGVLSKVGFVGRMGEGSHISGEAAESLETRCEVVAARCDLTPRERDVLLLLARGRTLSVVARELNIAEGTARTHMMHIYTKLGVHKQQELIDMVENESC